MTTKTPIDFRNVRTTTDPAGARRFAEMDAADKTAITLRHATPVAFPQAHVQRHPHGATRGFAVTTSPGDWLAG